MKTKTIYYSDSINDDFANTNIKTKLTPENFIYIHKNPIFKFFEFIVYWIIAKPLVWLYIKIAFHQKYVNKKVLKEGKKTGYFIYGNHTLMAADAFIPNCMRGKKNYIITGPDATSIKGIRNIVVMLGAIPLPSSLKGTRKYLDAIKELINRKRIITIYPEAHIWPYYTEIRPFKSDSFRYPVDLNVPVYSFTNVYLKSKNKLRKKPVIKTYINGPFYPSEDLSRKEAIEKLRNEVYKSMVFESNKQEQYKYKYIYKQKD